MPMMRSPVSSVGPIGPTILGLKKSPSRGGWRGLLFGRDPRGSERPRRRDSSMSTIDDEIQRLAREESLKLLWKAYHDQRSYFVDDGETDEGTWEELKLKLGGQEDS